MVLVDSATGEVLADITAEEARSITDRIKVAVEGAWHLIKQAYETRCWAALGYSSWDDYCTREFGTSRLKLPREERREVVASLRDSGLSTRAIGAATGLSEATVRRDLAGASNDAPAPEAPDPQAAYDALRTSMITCLECSTRGGGHLGSCSKAPKVTGTDGKSYAAKPAQPSKPKRTPLPDTAQRAGWEFRKAVERLERIAADDRFAANKEQVAVHLHGHLSYALEVCQDLLAQLDHQS